MKRLLPIIQHDWIRLRRSKTFWILCLVFTGMAIYAAWYGRTEAREQQRKIALVQSAIDQDMKTLETALRQRDSVAWDYEPLYKTVFSNRPDGMAALAFGQRDLHKFVLEISEGTYYYNKYATGYSNKTLSGEIVNPQKQLAGHLDMSFVIVFLLPLFFILLSYNIVSEEVENGTLSLLRIHAVTMTQITLAKLILRYALTLLLSLLLLLLAAAITGSLGDPRIGIFAGVLVMYTLFWAGLTALVTGLGKSSGFNALVLICAWLLVCIVLPAGINAYLSLKFPAVNKIALASTVQQANAAVFAMPRVEASDSFYAIHPQYDNLPGDTLPNGWYNPRWMRSVHALLDLRVDRLEKLNNAQMLAKMETVGRANYFSPAILAQNIMTTSAGSNMRQLFAFDTSAWHAFQRWNDYLDERIFFKENRFTQADFSRLPKFSFTAIIDYSLLLQQLLFIATMGMALLFAGLWLTRKNKKFN